MAREYATPIPIVFTVGREGITNAEPLSDPSASEEGGG